MDTTPLDELVTHAHDTHVIVVGAGIAGLVAALECAKVGVRVTLVEASDRAGGVVTAADVGGVRVDLGAEGYSTRGAGGGIRALVHELGLDDRVAAPAPGSAWLATRAGTVPLPKEAVLGIPENSWDEGVRRIIGWRGAWRAYVDRLRPPLTIGQQRSLGKLVRTRMGAEVLDALVAPVSVGAFAIHPDDVDVEVAAPGLSAALTRTGSLSGAVAQLRAARAPGGAIEGLDGGMQQLVDALVRRLTELEVTVHLDTEVTSIRRAGEDWVVQTSTDAAPAADGIAPAQAVIVAAPEAAARRLLAPLAPSLAEAPGPTANLDVVTLVIESAELTGAPRRTALYPAPGRSRAVALTDATARWGWVRASAGTDIHVLRVTFGGRAATLDDDTSALSDAEITALAVAEASALLGISLRDAQVRGSHRAVYAQPRPVSALGHAKDSRAARTAIGGVRGLAAVGAWISGTGLAQVVPDAIAESDRVRRDALWGSQPSDEAPN